jgi:D-xylose transport system permease protein
MRAENHGDAFKDLQPWLQLGCSAARLHQLCTMHFSRLHISLFYKRVTPPRVEVSYKMVLIPAGLKDTGTVMGNNETIKKLSRTVQLNTKSFTMIIALLLIWVFFAALTDGVFLKPQNLSNLFRQMTIISFLSIGMVLVIVTGNIDLSVGSVVGFISAVGAYLQAVFLPKIMAGLVTTVPPFWIGVTSTTITVIICLMAGLAIGLWQGSLTAYLGIPSFIVTLGGMMIFRGGVLGITQGKTIVPIEDSLVYIAQGYQSETVGLIIAGLVILAIFSMTIWNRRQKKSYGFELRPAYLDLAAAGFFSCLVLAYILFIANGYRGLQNPVLVMAVVAAVFSYISTSTRFGRYCYAIGGNKEATRLSGVDIRKNVFIVFILMGLLCGVAGVVLTGYVAAGTIGGGTNYELSTIAACVIGGTSLMGGEGTIFGALIGSLIMASLENGMSVMNMDIFWQYIIKGLVLIIAVYLDVLSKKKARIG